MMLMWLYALPMWVGLPLFIAFVVAGSWLILLSLRRWVRRTSRGSGEWDRILGYAVAVYGVFYGVTLALIASASYADFSDVDAIVLQESSSVAVLYRDASGFPEPERGELQTLLTDYTSRVIEVEWPAQSSGDLPNETTDEVDKIERLLFGFQPQTEAESNVQEETIDAFNQFVADRRARVAVTELQLPGVLWIVLTVGAVLNAVLLGLIEARSLRVHLAMSGLIAVFVAMLIFAIAGFDRPYSGSISVEPTYFIELRDGLLHRDG
ncbi:Protein of unknown function [Microbacterium pygmaeum]|uniref:DUF4239 domain-containing protein n=2 Tax=Microbacterium pygmaeum TaxID=370764 RepID=A0A1G7WL42_9MICO|nr:Protein of unknown function [Microbacterium pygmaeum]